ncbi:hypothetical protein [Paenibacillus sp. SAFN-117]|uniref:hypothetical protein n=1 Tax=Paenibacillus sp. SAFN-117 TaxID=3436860 RepID=UPI003F8046CF
MKWFKHYFIMWIPFMVLFIFATFSLELVEGNKITTTEYMGLLDLGLIYFLVVMPFAFLLYPVSFLPLTIILCKLFIPFIGRAIIFSVAGGIGGMLIFKKLYGWHDGYFIEGYNLNLNSAILIFGLAGLLYAWIDRYLKVNRGKAIL